MKDHREKSGLSQLEVADTLGYSSAQFVSNWERGLCEPPLKSLKKLCRILDINEKEILRVILKEQKAYLEKVLLIKDA